MHQQRCSPQPRPWLQRLVGAGCFQQAPSMVQGARGPLGTTAWVGLSAGHTQALSLCIGRCSRDCEHPAPWQTHEQLVLWQRHCLHPRSLPHRWHCCFCGGYWPQAGGKGWSPWDSVLAVQKQGSVLPAAWLSWGTDSPGS